MGKIPKPWDDIPANDNTRGGFHAGPGGYQGHGLKAKIGRIRQSSVISRPKDKTAHKKGIKLA